MLQEIDHFDRILPCQMFFTNLLQIGKCGKAFGGLPGNVKPQLIGL
jgi:hypothetical protein